MSAIVSSPRGSPEASEDECDVAADVTILMIKPVGERRQHARVLFAGDGLRDLDCFQKTFSFLNCSTSATELCVASTGVFRRCARFHKDDDIVIAFCERNASGRRFDVPSMTTRVTTTSGGGRSDDTRNCTSRISPSS